MSLCYVIIAALRTKCAADLDELLEFKVKQYVQGSGHPQYNTMHHTVVCTYTDVQAMEVKSDDYRLFANFSG